MKDIFKKNIDSIAPYEPGKPIEEVERELGVRRVVKLASNENPLGPSPRVLKGLRKKLNQIYLYPDGGAYKLRIRLAKKLEVRESQLVIGNGSNEIIEFVVKGFLKPGDRVLTSEYAFLVYPLLTQVYDGQLVTVPMKNNRFDLEAMAARLDERVRVVFIANPNNPTGTYVTRAELERFLSRVPKDCIVCLDEAYFDFAVDQKDYPNGLDYINEGNVVVLRSFSKSYALAGLRIGYAVSTERIAKYFNKIRQPFNVNLLAQEAAWLALSDPGFLKRTQRVVRQGKAYFYREFKRLGLDYVPSATNFILVHVGEDSVHVFQECLKRGVIIRSMKPYGLNQSIRISIGKPDENKKCIRVLKEVLRNNG